VLGDLEKRAKKLKKDLESCRRRGVSHDQVAMEEVLRYQLEKVEEQIDLYWRQQAHVRWLEKGDKTPPSSMQHAQRGGGQIELGGFKRRMEVGWRRRGRRGDF
jgi:hypothetical protein